MPRAEAAVPLLEVVGESVEVAEAPAGAASSHADAPALEPEQPEAGGGDDLLGRIRSVTGASAAIGAAALAPTYVALHGADGDLVGGRDRPNWRQAGRRHRTW